MSEIGTLYSGLSGKSKQDFSGGLAPYVDYKTVFSGAVNYMDDYPKVVIADGERQNTLRRGDVLFTASSEDLGSVGMSSVVTSEPDEPLYLNSFCFGFRSNDLDVLAPEFARHLFRADVMRRQIVKTANGVTRINISKDRFRRMRLPLPALSDQRRIADVLDRFDAMISDLTSGLPAEIAARRQQYEYYRDKLLTFDEAV